MALTVLTEAQVQKIINDPDSENFPWRRLTEEGKRAVESFVRGVYREGGPSNIDAWYDDAEKELQNSLSGETIILEVGRHYTASGNPETMTLTDSMYEWVI